MVMQILVIGPAEFEQIAELRAVAAAMPLHAMGMVAASAQDEAAFRDAMRTHAIFIPHGFAVVYTHEIQPNAPPPGLFHHISISVNTHGKLPSPEAVETILEAFGMQSLNASDGVWIEDISQGEKAVNVLQLIKTVEGGSDA